jgi:8-oxo-dGTP diphosphatase
MDIGVSVVVVNSQGKILLTKRQDLENWVFPGGGIERGESLEKGAVREVKEETGVRVKVERLAAVSILDHFLKRNVNFIFLASFLGGKTRRQKGEVLSICWANLAKANKLLGKRHLWRLRKALSKDKTVKVVVEKKLPTSILEIPVWWWRRNLGKKLGMVRE